MGDDRFPCAALGWRLGTPPPWLLFQPQFLAKSPLEGPCAWSLGSFEEQGTTQRKERTGLAARCGPFSRMIPGPQPRLSGPAGLQPSASLSPSLSLLLCLSLSLSDFSLPLVSLCLCFWLHPHLTTFTSLLHQELSSAPFLVSTTIVFV